jgi:FecCD transport family
MAPASGVATTKPDHTATRRQPSGWLRLPGMLAGLAAALAVSITVGVSVRSVWVPPAEVWTVIGRHVLPGAGGGVVEPTLDVLVWELRLPRVLLAAVIGFSLGVVGTVLQAVVATHWPIPTSSDRPRGRADQPSSHPRPDRNTAPGPQPRHHGARRDTRPRPRLCSVAPALRRTCVAAAARSVGRRRADSRPPPPRASVHQGSRGSVRLPSWSSRPDPRR